MALTNLPPLRVNYQCDRYIQVATFVFHEWHNVTWCACVCARAHVCACVRARVCRCDMPVCACVLAYVRVCVRACVWSFAANLVRILQTKFQYRNLSRRFKSHKQFYSISTHRCRSTGHKICRILYHPKVFSFNFSVWYSRITLKLKHIVSWRPALNRVRDIGVCGVLWIVLSGVECITQPSCH
jgi:hypothetical protein